MSPCSLFHSETDTERVCVCVCVCVRERERERERDKRLVYFFNPPIHRSDIQRAAKETTRNMC